jgi:hypothetical protein
MSDARTVPENVRLMAERHGLSRALALFPDQVMAAAERGLRPLAELPSAPAPTAHPAPVFDPARFERDE